MIKAVIFDYGGVLKKEFPLPMEIIEIYGIAEEELLSLKNETIPLHRLLNQGRIIERDYWQEISKAIKKPMPKDWEKLSREIYEKYFSLETELLKFARDLKKLGLKVAVLSNIAEFQAEIIRKHAGYEGFDIVVLSYEEKTDKPEKDIYLSTIKRLKVKPRECIFIDDRERNLLPAEELGMKTVLAKNTKQIIKDVRAMIKS